MHSKRIREDFKALIFVILSSLVYSVSIKVFVESGGLFPGGFAGCATLISRLLDRYAGLAVPFGVIYLLLNLGPTILVFRHVGKRFTVFSILQYTLTSIFTAVLPSYPITDDIFLIAVFGGILSGFGISLALTVNASSGGTDFIAIYAASRFKKPTWSYVMAFNVLLLLVAGLLFGWRASLYSIVFQFCSTQVVSAMHKRFKLNTLFIVTQLPDQVSAAIFQTCRHGITRLSGEGGYSHKETNLLYMTVNAFQVQEIIQAVMKADPHAFINVSKTEQIVGNYYQEPLD